MSPNKRMLSDWFSAALQTSRKCGRQGANQRRRKYTRIEMYEFSVEQAANNIHDHRTKEYFREVMNNYFNGNHRSALVMLWTVVICDLVYKLQYLKDIHGDEKAKSILDEMEDFQEKNPANPKWEENLLKEIFTRTSLLE